MILKALEVENYRNIPAARFEPGRELTVICGKNGQGKTNLLEAVWLLTGGKSFRGAKDAELIRENAGYAVAEGETQGFGKESRIRVFVGGQPGARKARTVRVNGVDYGRAANAAGTFTAVVFAPGHLSLVKGSPDGTAAFSGCSVMSALSGLCRRFCAGIPGWRRQKNALVETATGRRPDANGTAGCVRRKAGRERCALLSWQKGRNILRSSSRRSRGHTGTSPARSETLGHSVRAVFRAGNRALAPVLRESPRRGTSRQASVRRDLTGRIFAYFHRRPGGKEFSPARGSSAALCSA